MIQETHSSCPRVMALVVLLIAIALSAAPIQAQPGGESRYPGLAFPTARYDRDGAVPFNELQLIANFHAAVVWPDGFAPGPALPVADENGSISAYFFPYATGTATFPDRAALLETVSSLWLQESRHTGRTAAKASPEFFQELERQMGSFGSILVSATRDNFPILAVYHSLHPYYLFGEVAQTHTRRALETDDLTLDKIYFLGPHELYFGFASTARHILTHAYTLELLEPEDAFARKSWSPPDTALDERREQAWSEVLERAPVLVPDREVGVTHTIKNILYYRMIPIVDWTWWCVPTAATMVAGFWDNYAKGVGTVAGYGRLIDFWFDHSSGHNVPNILDEIIDPATGTWSSQGFLGTLNNTNGYEFTWTNVNGTPSNDWAWGTLKAEVDAGRPCMWSARSPNNPQAWGPHAMTAFGYRIFGSQRFVAVYNTWGSTANQQSAAYNYDQWGGGTVTQTGVDQLLHGGGSGGDHSILISPDGGEVVYGPTPIVWYTWGNAIDKTDLYESYDGGKTWSLISNGVATKPGWNKATWTPSKQTSKARVRLRSVSASGALVSGDGSQKNFFVKLESDLVPSNPSPNWGGAGFCSRDAQGRLIVYVKNQGTVNAQTSTAQVDFGSSGTVNVSTPAVPAGGTVKVAVDIPSGCFSADCDFEIKVDSQNSVGEANEGNNAAFGWCIG